MPISAPLVVLPGPAAFVDAVRAVLGHGPLTRCEVLHGAAAAAWQVPAAPEDSIALVLATRPDVAVVILRFTHGDPGDAAEGIRGLVARDGNETDGGWFQASDHDWPADPLDPAVQKLCVGGVAPRHSRWTDGAAGAFDPSQFVGRTPTALEVRRSGVRLTCDDAVLEIEASWGVTPDGYFPYTLAGCASHPDHAT